MTNQSPEERHPVADDPLSKFMTAIMREKGDARSSLLLAHGVIELFVTCLVDAHCKNAKRITSDSRGYPHSTRLVLLHEIGVLSDGVFKSLEWFRRLRNRAAHDPLFELAPSDLERVSPDLRDINRFNDVCVYLVVGFWNEHLDDLLPRFAPSLAEAAAAEAARGQSGENQPNVQSSDAD